MKLGRSDAGLQMGTWDEFHVRKDGREIDATQLPVISQIFFPLLALLMPAWELAMDQPSNSEKVLYLIAGSGTPRNPKHDEDGNSTFPAARLLQLFVETFFPDITVVTVDSGKFTVELLRTLHRSVINETGTPLTQP